MNLLNNDCVAYSKVRCPTKLKGTFAMHVSSPMVEKNHRRTWRIRLGRKSTKPFHVPPKVVGMSCLFIWLCVARYHFTLVQGYHFIVLILPFLSLIFLGLGAYVDPV